MELDIVVESFGQHAMRHKVRCWCLISGVAAGPATADATEAELGLTDTFSYTKRARFLGRGKVPGRYSNEICSKKQLFFAIWC